MHNGALGRAHVFEELVVSSTSCTLEEDVERQKNPTLFKEIWSHIPALLFTSPVNLGSLSNLIEI